MLEIDRIKDLPLLLDASVLLCGADLEASDTNYCFDNMKQAYLEPVFNHFSKMLIHEEVWKELDESRKQFIQPLIGQTVAIVREGGLYNSDPQYNTTFNKIRKHPIYNYNRGEAKNRGDVFTLVYAAHFKIPLISTRDGPMEIVVAEEKELQHVEIVGFEKFLTLGYEANRTDADIRKRLKALYKRYCGPSIKKGLIPETLLMYINTLTFK